MNYYKICQYKKHFSFVSVGLDLKPYYDRGEKLSIISATCELHFDEHGYKELYYPDENYLPQKLAGEINFVVIGDTIVGQGFNNFIHPLLNERGNIVLIKGADRVEISPEEAEIHGVFRFYKVEFATPNYEHSAQPNCGHHVSG